MMHRHCRTNSSLLKKKERKKRKEKKRKKEKEKDKKLTYSISCGDEIDV